MAVLPVSSSADTDLVGLKMGEGKVLTITWCAFLLSLLNLVLLVVFVFATGKELQLRPRLTDINNSFSLIEKEFERVDKNDEMLLGEIKKGTEEMKNKEAHPF